MKIYPAIDLRHGRVVRLAQGRFDAQTVYRDDPVRFAEELAQGGAKRLHVVDLDGAEAGGPRQTDMIRKIIAASGLEVQVGGGIRSADDVERLLEAGAGAVVIGSLAVREYETAARLLEAIGGDRFVLAADCRIDSRGRAVITSSGWKETENVTVSQLVARYQPLGLTRVLCTDVACDGVLEGPSVALYERLVETSSGISWIASGGIRSADDLVRVETAGCAGAIVGKALYEGLLDIADIARWDDAAC